MSTPTAGVCAILVANGMDESENPVLNVVRNVARLAALTQSGLLDSPPEEAFDRFTRLASHVLRARTALLSLVDEDRQFFKSAQGLSEPWATKRETPITYSICKHVVANASGVVLPEAKLDRVVGGCPGIDALRLVAYAGMPVRSIDGHVLGALCVMDDKRREWTTGELDALRDLADCVTEEIVLRTQINQLQNK
jgi:GAF domain-containing protein